MPLNKEPNDQHPIKKYPDAPEKKNKRQKKKTNKTKSKTDWMQQGSNREETQSKDI